VHATDYINCHVTDYELPVTTKLAPATSATKQRQRQQMFVEATISNHTTHTWKMQAWTMLIQTTTGGGNL
jgi:hypothetical protein